VVGVCGVAIAGSRDIRQACNQMIWPFLPEHKADKTKIADAR
jgi:hypothetical protein